MLYLFLTGNRSAYLNAIFTVLHFPANTVYDLKYKISDENSIVADSANEKKCAVGEKTLILFNNEQGEYVPLRLGILQKCIIEESQIYYSVKLTDYCHVKDKLDFCKFIDKLAMPKKIRWIKDKSGNAAEGILAFRYENSNVYSNLNRTKDSWIRTVRTLSDAMRKMDIFRHYYLVFTKMEIRTAADNNLLHSKEGRINLKSGKDYKFHMTYYIPEFNESPMEFISAKFYQSPECLGMINDEAIFFSQQNKIDIVCSPRTTVTENRKVTFGFKILQQKINGKIIQYVRTPLELNLKTRMSKVIRQAIIGICIGASFIGTYLAGIKLGEDAKNFETILNLSGSFATTLATVGLIYFIGKPKL